MVSRAGVPLLLAAMAALLLSPGCGIVGPAASLARGQALVNKGDYAGARKAFDEAHRRRPTDGQLAMQVAAIWAQAKQYQEAIAVLQRSLKARPNADVYTLLGDICTAAQQYPEAERAYESAYSMGSRSPALLNNLGYLWADQEKSLPRAVAMLEDAARQKPNDPNIQDSLGWAYYKSALEQRRTGNAEAARKLLAQARDQVEQAVDALPGQAEVVYHLGVIYAAMGYEEDARAQLRRALILAPRMKAAKDALNALGQPKPAQPAPPAPRKPPPPPPAEPNHVPTAGRSV